jgi:hypothetical protein
MLTHRAKATFKKVGQKIFERASNYTLCEGIALAAWWMRAL